MMPEVLSATLAVGGLTALIVAIAIYSLGRGRIERTAHRLLSSQSVCVECLETPVLVPGGVCKTCQKIARDIRTAPTNYCTKCLRTSVLEVGDICIRCLDATRGLLEANYCPLCFKNRVLVRNTACSDCIDAFSAQLNNWGIE